MTHLEIATEIQKVMSKMAANDATTWHERVLTAYFALDAICLELQDDSLRELIESGNCGFTLGPRVMARLYPGSVMCG